MAEIFIAAMMAYIFTEVIIQIYEIVREWYTDIRNNRK